MLCIHGSVVCVIFFVDDAQKLSSIRLLRGYIQLLGSQIDVILLSSVHLQRLSAALCNILQFDCSIIQIIEEKSTGKVAVTAYVA